MTDETFDTILALTADIVAAHVGNNNVSVSDVPALIQNVHGALTSLGTSAAEPQVEQQPSVSVRSSVKPDYIVCLEDGKKLKMLKRYLASNFNMTPAEYRAKWKLPADYPMVAPNYSSQRKDLAHKMGLGRKKAAPAPAAAPAASAAPAAPKRGRGRPAAVKAK
jgi:predicted transcriptional regulator